MGQELKDLQDAAAAVIKAVADAKAALDDLAAKVAAGGVATAADLKAVTDMLVAGAADLESTAAKDDPPPAP